jgi:hypothetical protein
MDDPHHAQEYVLMNCWACNRAIKAPVYHGVAIPLVECTFCAAWNEDVTAINPINANVDRSNNSQLPDWILRPPPTIKRRRFPTGASVAAVAVVAAISLVWAACTLVFIPEMFRSAALVWPCVVVQCLGTLLFGFVLHAYFQICLTPPGPVAPYVTSLLGSDERITPRMFENYRWCAPCGYAKPPHAHHCRRCDSCVVSLDHHCTFTGCCIGASNMPHFMRFLKLTLMGSWMAAVTCMMYGRHGWDHIVTQCIATWTCFASLPSPLNLLTYSIRWTWGAPWRLSLWSAALVFSLSAGVGVALLLRRQLRVASAGSTVLQDLKRRRKERDAVLETSRNNCARKLV